MIEFVPLLWTFLQAACSLGISYGAFIVLYYYTINNYKRRPPETINNRFVLKEKWESVCDTCDRYPFYHVPETVLEAGFKTNPVTNQNHPLVNHTTLKFSQKVGLAMGYIDETAVWIAMVSAGRSMLPFMYIQFGNLLIFASVGLYAGVADPIAKYVRLPIKKLE